MEEDNEEVDIFGATTEQLNPRRTRAAVAAENRLIEEHYRKSREDFCQGEWYVKNPSPEVSISDSDDDDSIQLPILDKFGNPLAAQSPTSSVSYYD